MHGIKIIILNVLFLGRFKAYKFEFAVTSLLKILVPLTFKLLTFNIEQLLNEFKLFNIVVLVVCKFDIFKLE